MVKGICIMIQRFGVIYEHYYGITSRHVAIIHRVRELCIDSLYPIFPPIILCSSPSCLKRFSR